MTTQDKTPVRALIEAVEAGTLPEAVFHGCSAIRGHWAYTTGLTEEQRAWVYMAYNGSLGAALALHGALLPGWALKLWACDNDDADAQVYPPIIAPHANYKRVEGVDIFSAEVDGYNPARAWLLAILRAYEEQQ